MAVQLLRSAPRASSPARVFKPTDARATARAVVAERFTLGHFPALRHWQGGWFRWDGTYYEPVSVAEVERAVLCHLSRPLDPDSTAEPLAELHKRTLVALAALVSIEDHAELPTRPRLGREGKRQTCDV